MRPLADDVHELVGRRLREADQVYTKGRRELVELLLVFGRPASSAASTGSTATGTTASPATR